MSAERSTHIVYRIGTDFSWQETPCFCPAERDHPVDQTRPYSTAQAHSDPTSPDTYDWPEQLRAEVARERDEEWWAE